MRSKRCASRNARASVRIRHALGVLGVAAACGVSGLALGQAVFKWVDKDGKVHFADKPPTNFKGEVTRITPDAQPDPVAPRPKAKPEAVPIEEEKAPDANARRRATREHLAARVAAARAKLEQARRALADGEGAGDDEKQFVQERLDRNARRPERTPPPRSNCMSQVTPDGKPIWICPRPVPGQAYYERREKLEEAVRKAEEELDEAQRAYRRGVD